jgi:hypothetical protein
MSPEGRYDLARDHALLAGLAAEGLSPAEGQAEADRALAVLMQLVAEGDRNPNAGTDPDPAPLRGRDDFRRLALRLMDRAVPADPFVGAR